MKIALGTPYFPAFAGRIEATVSGIALLEAAAITKPIINARNTWSTDTSSSSSEETAKAIFHLLKNPDKRIEIAELCFEKVTSERSGDFIASKYLELCNRIIDRNQLKRK